MGRARGSGAETQQTYQRAKRIKENETLLHADLTCFISSAASPRSPGHPTRTLHRRRHPSTVLLLSIFITSITWPCALCDSETLLPVPLGLTHARTDARTDTRTDTQPTSCLHHPPVRPSPHFEATSNLVRFQPCKHTHTHTHR